MSSPSDRPFSALLLVLSGNMLIDSLEVSTVVTAMPPAGGALHVSPAASSGFMLSFAIGFGGFIPLGRRVTARFGRRRVYLGSLLVFAAASLAAGFAVSPAMLDAARVVKGACVALTAPAGLAIIATTFPEGPSRQKAISVYSMFGASGFSAGLLISGALALINWRWALLFSGASALALFPMALGYVPADHRDARLAASPRTAPSPRSAPAAEPAKPSRYWPLVRSAAGAAMLNGPYWGFLFLATFALQARAGWTPLETGLALLPTSLPLALTALHASRLARRFGPGPLIALGSLAALAGYAWYLRSGPRPVYLTGLLPTALLVGIAFMLSFSALHLQATTGVPASRQAAVAAVYQACVQLGGAAVLAAGGTRLALATVTAFAAAGALIAVIGPAAGATRRMRPPAGQLDHRTAGLNR